jgi:endo-1,4-beta-xylanase
LKEAARGTGLYIGSAVNYNALQEDQDFMKLVTEEVSIMTPENQCKMPQIAKSWTEFNYTACDYMINFAKERNIKFRAHFLMSASIRPNPSWIMNEKNMTKLEEFMKSYIKTTVSHVGDNVLSWDVVNEAIDNA